MSTSQASDDEIEEIYEKIEELISHNGKDNLIVMGDWNAIVGEEANGKEVGKYGLGARNERGDRLVKFCRQHDLITTNTLFKDHKRRRYTSGYIMPGDINRHQLDYTL